MKRKSPSKHPVRAHMREGSPVKPHSRGSGAYKPKTPRSRKVIQTHTRIDIFREAIQKHIPNEERHSHTSGTVIVDKNTVLKPVTGIKEYDEWDGKHKKFKFKTHEWDAIQALQDLPNIPQDTELITIDGFDYIIRGNYIILDDLKMLKRPQLIQLEKTLREVNKRGWDYGDTIQIAVDPKNKYQPILFDWSTAIYTPKSPHLANDNFAISTLWKEAGYEREMLDREKGESLRFDYNLGVEQTGHKGIFRLEDEPYLNYAYLSYPRPPSKMWMKLPKSSVITYIKPEKGWRVLGQIYTEEPLSEHLIKAYELTPTKHIFSKEELSK